MLLNEYNEDNIMNISFDFRSENKLKKNIFASIYGEVYSDL